jgi:hypothetical protein
MQLRAMAVALGSNGHSGLLTQGDKGQGKREPFFLADLKSNFKFARFSCRFKIKVVLLPMEYQKVFL